MKCNNQLFNDFQAIEREEKKTEESGERKRKKIKK